MPPPARPWKTLPEQAAPEVSAWIDPGCVAPLEETAPLTWMNELPPFDPVTRIGQPVRFRSSIAGASEPGPLLVRAMERTEVTRSAELATPPKPRLRFCLITTANWSQP